MKKSITKKSRKKLFSRKPSNYGFWYWTVSNKKDIKLFLERGDTDQLKHIKRTLKYIKKYNIERFKEINGEKILQQLLKKEK
jgi:hypothetical protein